MSEKSGDDDFLAKYTDLNLQYAELKTQYDKIKDENAELKREISKHRSDALPEDAEKILIALADVASNDGETARVIAESVKLSEVKTQYHLGELALKNLVRAGYAMQSETYWALTQEGRKYLMQRDLLK